MTRSAQPSKIPRRVVAIGLAWQVVVLLACAGLHSKLRGTKQPTAPAASSSSQLVTGRSYHPRKAAPLTDAQRRKGYHECNPPDPIGFGPYSPYRRLRRGHLLVPQKGGYTEDMAYDVIIHFHGYEAVRKTLVQVAYGVAYVGMDFGIGSGPYAKAFRSKEAFPNLLASIERGLQEETENPRAHIRHLAISAWSAGYGAINQILKHGDEGIDAVVLLDGLHAGWKPGARKKQRLSSVSPLYIQPIIDYADAAAKGEGGRIFVFTHSQVNPVSYPSTTVTADLLLSELSLKRSPARPTGDPYGLIGSIDVAGFHSWSYRGRDEKAHCTHIDHIAKVITEVLEPTWQTPHMDRNVPFNKVSKHHR